MIYFAHGDEIHETTEVASGSTSIVKIVAVGLIALSIILILTYIRQSSNSKSD